MAEQDKLNVEVYLRKKEKTISVNGYNASLGDNVNDARVSEEERGGHRNLLLLYDSQDHVIDGLDRIE